VKQTQSVITKMTKQPTYAFAARYLSGTTGMIVVNRQPSNLTVFSNRGFWSKTDRAFAALRLEHLNVSFNRETIKLFQIEFSTVQRIARSLICRPFLLIIPTSLQSVWVARPNNFSTSLAVALPALRCNVRIIGSKLVTAFAVRC
jgi:hypothetical protein